MPTYLFDTNAISDVIRKQPRMAAKLATQPGTFVTSVIVRGEIRYGLERLPRGKRRTDLEAKSVPVLAGFVCELLTEPVADIYGRIKSDLEGRGLSLDANDLWIAATALRLGAVLVSRDSDFAQVPGLSVENWTK